jgi:hypothetical protein
MILPLNFPLFQPAQQIHHYPGSMGLADNFPPFFFQPGSTLEFEFRMPQPEQNKHQPKQKNPEQKPRKCLSGKTV